MTDIIKAAQISTAWSNVRDAYHSIMTMFEPNDDKYRDRCAFWQNIIKNVMVKHSLCVSTAVIWIQENVLKDEESGMGLMALLASGYELLTDNDFTITKTSEGG